MKNLEEVIISVTKGAEEVEAKFKWNGRRYVTSNGMKGKLVRCEDCKYRETCCRPCYKSADSYCSDGEREGE